jgi:outer membrane protein OmpA-like peptidoglycan-associated protein
LWLDPGGKLRLVRATDALRLSREEGCEVLPALQAIWLVDRLDRRRSADVRSFVSRAFRSRYRLTGLDDNHLWGLLASLLKARELIAIGESEAESASESGSTAEQRRLVSAIAGQTRGGRLQYAGREYRLTADADLGRVPNRSNYEVVRRVDAEQVLSNLAKPSAAGSGGLANLFERTRGLLSKDWRPPFAPDGLVLLRKARQTYASVGSPEPAITPSQMKKLLADWIEIEVEDEDGIKYTGPYSLELPDSTSIDGTFDDNGFYGSYAIDSGKCKLFLPGRKAKADEFMVTVVDEIGKPIPNVAMVFRNSESSLPATTDSSGVAKRQIPNAKSVRASFASVGDLADTMKAIWASPRKVERKDWVQADETTETVNLLGGLVVKTAAPDEDSPPSDLEVEPFAGLDLSPGSPAKLSVQPLVILASLLEEHFDTDKCFILPKAKNDVFALIRLCRQYPQTDILVTGHTDRSGDDSHNLTLSLDRAKAMRAYLTSDVDSWLAWYESGKPASQRWGKTEDGLMIGALLEGSAFPPTVLGYQQWHNSSVFWPDGYEELDEDGEIGPKTRKQLVGDYMHLGGATVPKEAKIEVHGCGEFFPLADADEDAESEEDDGQDDAHDRRVEVFLFPKEVGIAPPVPGDTASKGEAEYPEWRTRSIELDFASADSLDDCIVSVILMSNSGNVVLSHRPYQLKIENGPVLEGKTDSEGFLEHAGLPAGDHTLVVDGCESRVGATPPDCTRRIHMMAGYVLIQDALGGGEGGDEGDDGGGDAEADAAGDGEDDSGDEEGGDA